jgi:hypothetical protein
MKIQKEIYKRYRMITKHKHNRKMKHQSSKQKNTPGIRTIKYSGTEHK